MKLVIATDDALPVVEHGRTEIHLPHWSGVEQQHGFVHGGVVGMIADSAAGYASMTMVPANASVLTVEYKMNLVAPADGEKLIARGKVVRPGRTLVVTQAEVFAVKDGKVQVMKTPNGENPLMMGAQPILGVDVWEHSYYIDFRNKRPAYLTNFLDKLVDWEAVAARM